ncbi:DEKNAAC105373 [Brettanomyces naardenensis]|uniref:DEKNAAC105373 n=1 Tax=Brettanomyces naardenensis TaxID=13370 RepID=A0A448YTD7_BRENA|nr:DEKNAAC105373 [Brettanomyces naardenensis]
MVIADRDTGVAVNGGKNVVTVGAGASTLAVTAFLAPGKRKDTSPPRKRKRTKTFSGCYTCRRRKIACDLGRPTCAKCRKSGYVCEGYDVKLRFSQPISFDKYGYQLPGRQNQETEYCQRRSIDFVRYSDADAYHMYDEMDSDLASLHNLNLPNLSAGTVIKGKFGVFRGILGAKKVDGSRSTSMTPAASTAKTVAIQSNVSTPTSVASSSMAPPNMTRAGSFTRPQRQRVPYNYQPTTVTDRNLGNEWLSTELLDAALLTASAINGDTHFLDMFKPDDLDGVNYAASGTTGAASTTSTDPPLASPQLPTPSRSIPDGYYQRGGDDTVSDNMLHLLFQGRNTNKPEEDTASDSTNQSQVNNNTSAIIGGNETTPVDATNTNNRFSRSDKPISNNSIGIHAGTGARMPKTIMEILETTPLPKSLAIDQFGIPTTSLNVHPMTRYLLNYYIEDVADMMTVIPLPKNPWKFIYFPRALMAVGELAALGHTSNARNGLLNALLAVSAFNLQSKFVRGSDEMKYYVNLGIQLRQQATNFLNKCLQEDVLKQKYKDVLVAVLSMVTIDVVWGTMSACKIHLDHCEKIIEKKMKVKKNLSSKAIILHRIFSSLKLIQDSTCIDNVSKDEIFLNEKNYESFLMGAKPTPEQLGKFFNSHFHDMFRGSRLRRMFARSAHGKQSFQDLSESSSASSSPLGGNNSLVGGSTEQSYRRGRYNERIADNGKVRIEFIMNDDATGIDNQKQQDSPSSSNGIPAFIGITRSSFQPSKNKLDDKVVSSDAIYGLPNSLILMFSEVVHLTKFKRYHTENKQPLPPFLDELTVQLEFKLLTWKLEWKLTEDDDKDTSMQNHSASDSEEAFNNEQNFISPRHEGIYHHVMSFYYGLIIYFYRFVEDVNPMYLQDRVEKVLHHLNAIQDILEKHPETSYIIPLFWQGFIAGSEAMTLYLQNGFNLWGQHIAQTGIGTYWNARQIILEIWRRKNHNVKNNSWTDVLRDWKTNVMLT